MERYLSLENGYKGHHYPGESVITQLTGGQGLVVAGCLY